METHRQCLFVQGMHRSGTSAMAGALSFVGLVHDHEFVSDEANDNPYGYWEPADVVHINDDIFLALGQSVLGIVAFPPGWESHKAMIAIRSRIDAWLDKMFDGTALVAVKDPRFCRTLPLWADAAATAGITAKRIHIFRHPMEVAKSLQARHGSAALPRDQFLLAWAGYVLASFTALPPTAAGTCAIVNRRTLIGDPVRTIEVIGELLCVEWPVSPRDVEADLRHFADPTLFHHNVTGRLTDGQVAQTVQGVYDLLNRYDLRSPDDAFVSQLLGYQDRLEEHRLASRRPGRPVWPFGKKRRAWN